MPNLHSTISTKVITSHTFVDVFANFDPRIMIISFWDSAQSVMLKTVQNHFSRYLGSHGCDFKRSFPVES